MRFVARDTELWLSAHRRWRLHVALAIGIVMAAGCAPRVCRTTIGAREIPCPLSRDDLRLVTSWIATEVVRSRQPFCWRRTYTTRPGRKCRRGYSGGRIGICWQKCTSGRKRCGLGCAKNGVACLKNTAAMIVAPLMLAVNIATFGSASGANTAVQAATKLAKLKKLFRQVAKRTKKYRKKAKWVIRAGTAAFELNATIRMWVKDYIADFSRMTTPLVNRELTRRFSGDALIWVEEQYALNHLNLIMKADGIRTAWSTLAIVATFDPTGVSGVISAFSKPKCPYEKPFPAVRLRSPYVANVNR